MEEKRHPGITMHRISFGGGLPGLVFTVGCALIFLFGLPALWYFVALAFGLGIGIAVFLRQIDRYRSQRNRPLSILTPFDTPGTHASRERRLGISRPLPKLISA